MFTVYTNLLVGQSYPLLTWANTGPSSASAFAHLILPTGLQGNLGVVGNTLALTVTTNTTSPLSWNTGNGSWNTSAANWLGASGPAVYQDAMNAVLFDDAPGASGNPTVTLGTTLSPLAVIMNSSLHHYTLSGAGGIGGAASLYFDPANTGSLTLAAASTYTGGTTINAGTLQLGANNVLPNGPGEGGVTINAGGTLDVNNFSAAINNLSGSGVVDNTGGGGGTLAVGSDNSSSTFNGVLQNTAGTLNLVKNGTGVLTLGAADTLTGTVTVNGGTLALNNANSISTASSLTLAGGTVLNPFANNVAINGPITLGAGGTSVVIYGVRSGSGTGTVFPSYLNGPITGAGNVIFRGGNQISSAPTINLNAPSTYTGSTLITCDPQYSSGVQLYVKLGINHALPVTTVVTLDGLSAPAAVRTTALDLNGFNQTLAGLTNVVENSTRRQAVINSSGAPCTLTLNNASGDTFTGQLGYSGATGSFGLTMNGSGILLLGGVNYYTGDTTINNGALVIGTGGQLGGGTYYGNVTIAGGSALSFASANSTTLYGGSLSGGGSLTNAGNGTLGLAYAEDSLPNTTVATNSSIALNGATVNALTIQTGGTLSLLGPSTVTNLSFTGAGSLNYDLYDGGSLTVVANNGPANNGPAGSITINITGNPPAPGTYTLITYSGTLPGSGFSAYTLGITPAGANYALVNTPGAVQLSVTPGLTWTGAQSSEWSTNAIAGLKNWTANAVPADYTNGATVVFDDSVGSGSTTPTISVANLTPQIVGFNNFGYNYTLQGSYGIAGPAYLIMSGSGTLTILNSNTYTGGSIINGGSLQVGNGGGTGTLGTGAITDNGDLQFNRTNTFAFTNTVSGTGTLEQNGGGTVALSGALSLPNAITVSAGELDLTNGFTNTLGGTTVAGASGAIVGLKGGATYNFGAKSLSVSTAAGGGTVNQSGGTVTFSSGSGILVGNGSGSPTGVYNLSGGTIQPLASFANGQREMILGVNGNCSGTLNLSGTGNLNFTYAGLEVGRWDSPASGCVATFNQTGGTAMIADLSIGGYGSAAANNLATVSLTGGSLNASLGNLAAGNGDQVTITIGGSAQVTLSAFPFPPGVGAVDNITFDSTTGYLSPAAASGNYIPAGTFNNAYLTASGAKFNVPSGSDITIGQLFADSTNQQAGTLTKSGTGALTLVNANTYSGGTTVNAGTLLAMNSTGSGTGTGAVIIKANATLGGTGTIAGAVTNSAGGTLAPGASGIGTLTLGGNVVLAANSTNTFEVNGSTPANDRVVLGGAVIYGGVLNIVPSGTFTNGQTFTLFSGAGAASASNFASLSGSPGSGQAFSFSNGVLSVVPAGPSGPAHLTNSLSGKVLNLSWPAGQGWRLQMQTNSLSVGLKTNWFYLTDGTLSSTNLTTSATNPTVFYRLTYP